VSMYGGLRLVERRLLAAHTTTRSRFAAVA